MPCKCAWENTVVPITFEVGPHSYFVPNRGGAQLNQTMYAFEAPNFGDCNSYSCNWCSFPLHRLRCNDRQILKKAKANDKPFRGMFSNELFCFNSSTSFIWFSTWYPSSLPTSQILKAASRTLASGDAAILRQRLKNPITTTSPLSISSDVMLLIFVSQKARTMIADAVIDFLRHFIRKVHCGGEF